MMMRTSTMTKEAEKLAPYSTPATLVDYVVLLRPSHWIKNIVVLAGPAAALKLSDPGSLTNAVIVFVVFCMAASATYAINDATDRDSDSQHPTKRGRPVARGAISPGAAVGLGLFLFLPAVGLAILLVNASTAAVVILYCILTTSYSLVLKRYVILDVILLASGFVLRAWGGSLAVGVVTSEWLVACVFTLCLFVGFGKRRAELAAMRNPTDAGRHRKALVEYTPDLLNHLTTVSAAVAVITFLLYTLEESGQTPFHKEYLFYTLPLVVYSIFRFAMLTELGIHGGPIEIVLKDRALLAAVSAWIIIALVVAYEEVFFGPGGLQSLFGST